MLPSSDVLRIMLLVMLRKRFLLIKVKLNVKLCYLNVLNPN